LIRIYFPLLRYIYFIIVVSFLFADEKKSSADIQKDINSRNTELQSIRKEIKNIELQLIHTNKEAISSTERLIALENKISLTEKLIRSLNREEKYISRVLLDTEMQIENMEKKLVKLKSQLRKRLQYLYIHGRPGILETVLLSEDWNSTIYRVKYLDVLATHEKKIRLDIAGNLDQLDDEKEKRSIELNHKKALLKEKKEEGKTLNKDKKKRKKILADLEKEKSQLKKSHTKKTQMVKEMEKLIKKLYADKAAVKKREEELARIRAAKNLATTGNFAKMKGRLSWPVDGRIISKYGNVRNPDLGTITENVGIDIKAPSGTKVQSVLDGVVSTITFIRGHGNIVIIDHGAGFSTVYAHIEKIIVSENSYIEMGDYFAVVAAPQKGETAKLHFEVWGNQKKLNPQKWLVAR
tara:strand:- start:1595 stop:2821 length:1227 start_codon:yes stop_codon:yes gene_type:complete